MPAKVDNRSTKADALAEMAAGARRVELLRKQIPERFRPSDSLVFCTFDKARNDIVALRGKGSAAQSWAIARDWEAQAKELLAHRLVHSPLEPAT
jgi:hypothetical protein